MLDLASSPPERRLARRGYVTVLFTDVVGSSEYAQFIEPEDYASVLERFRSFVGSVVQRHGGVIARMQGDGALVLFGHLASREDDGRRATEAALELHATTSALRVGSGPAAPRLQLHSGIHAGLVLVLEGDIERGRFDVVGEVPNTAARIVGLAAPGEVLVSAETLGPHASFFVTNLMRQLPIRGRVEPLDVLRIEGRRSFSRRIDAAEGRSTAGFVGRAAEFEALVQAAARARSAPATVLVVGEPGIGKTRLIGEFERSFRGDGRVLHGFCESYLSAAPLQPFLHWGRAALGWRADASAQTNDAAVTASLATLTNQLDDAARAAVRELVMGRGSLGTRPVAALIDLLLALAVQVPLLLVLDDWQWADDGTRMGLASLREHGVPLLLVLASRPLEPAHEQEIGDADILRLQPLSTAAAQSAIEALLPGAEPFLAGEILQQSGGTPLLIEELCLAVARAGSSLPGHGQVGLAWLDGLVASRLALLEPHQAACLETAAIIGHVFSAAQVAALVDDAVRTLESLRRLDFIATTAEPGMLSFRHALTREAVYNTVNAARRRELHRQVAESLETAIAKGDEVDHVEALAYHFEASGQAAKAARYSEAAGTKALAAMALDRARAHYVTALRSLDALAPFGRDVQLRWCAIAERLGQTCVFDPLDVSHGLRLFARAADLARATDDLNAVARAQYWLGYVNYGKGRPRAAVRHCEAALEAAQASNDTRLAAQVQATLGQSLASAGAYDRALPLLLQAVDAKRQQGRSGRGHAIGSAYTLGRIGYTLGDLGHFDEAYERLDEALVMLGDPVHSVGASLRELRCAVLLWQGRWAEAQHSGLEGAEIALRCRSRYLTAMGRALAACGGLALDCTADTLRALREPTHWIEASGGAVSTSLNYGWLVEGCSALEHDDELRQQAARLFARARAGDRHGLAMGRRALAVWLARRSAPPGRVQHQLDAADHEARRRGSARELAVNQLARAQVAALRGPVAQVRQHAETAAVTFETLRMRWHLRQALALLEEA